MAKTINAADLAAAIERELTIYRRDVVDAIDAAGQESVKKLVKMTRATAPVGARGSFKRNVTSKRLSKTDRGSTYVWYVKPPDHRLTHLLVHGHATKDGGRTRADPFLKKALSTVLPEYEKAIEEAVQNGK